MRAALDAHYRPNLKLAQAHGFGGYNCGYARQRGETSFAQHQRDLVWRVLADARIGPTTTVLDIGCGIGGPANWIVERFTPRRLIGLEYCWSSVRLAAQGAARHGISEACAFERILAGSNRDSARQPLCFVQGDAHHLPIADGSIDVILSLESALHYADKRRFLAECRRVLGSGGVICLGDITVPKTKSIGATLLRGLSAPFKSNAILWSAESYRGAFAAGGLAVLRHEQASPHVADSLADALDEVRRRGWKAARGFRMRFYYLSCLERLLRRGWLHYDLFALTRAE